MYQLRSDRTGRELGHEHGEDFRAQIKELSQIRRYLLRKFLPDFHPLDREKLAMRQVEFLKNHPDLYEEFCGISEASDVGLCDLMVLNNYTDMRDFSTADLRKDVDEGGCSIFATRTDDATVMGQTWDMHASARPYMLEMELNGQPGGSSQRILTVTGCLALTGVNSHRVGVMINNLHCTETGEGLAWGALVRRMLEQESAAEAQNYLDHNLPASGHNYMIVDRQEIMNLETTGQQYDINARVESGQTGSLFHTNHYVGKLVEFENGARRSPTTDDRWRGLDRFFNQQPDQQRWTMDHLASDLFGGEKVPEIMVPKPEEPHQSMTCGGLICDLEAGEGVFFGGVYDPDDRRVFKF